MDKRAQYDRMAWDTIHARPVPEYVPEKLAHLPRNYPELVAASKVDGWDRAWSHFLHQFLLYRHPSFLSERPVGCSPSLAAFLAGAAAWLSSEFSLPRPAWVDDSVYFLDEPFDIDGWWHTGTTGLERGLQQSPEEFRMRRVVFNPRGFIRL